MKITINKLTTLLLVFLLSSCSSTLEKDQPEQKNNQFKLSNSYLASEGESNNSNHVDTNEHDESNIDGSNPETLAKVQNLQALPRASVNLRNIDQLSAAFSDVPSLTISVNEMEVQDFLHYTFGELLNVNYIIDKDLKAKDKKITLNIKEEISPRRLMQLTGDILVNHQLTITFNDGLYFIHKPKKNKKGQGQLVIGVGKSIESVPDTSLDILQVVPLTYGIKISVERTLRQLVGVDITPDFEQSTLFLKGKRADILRAIDFINMLDAPANRGRHIGLINLTYINSEEFTKQVSLLLENEGIPVSINKPNRKNLVMVQIESIGAIVVFSSDHIMLNRVKYWASIIDKPQLGSTKQYFMYHPQYARASDLGDSLSALLSGARSSGAKTSRSTDSSKSNKSTGAAPSSNRNIGMSNKDITLVVDERANAIIFYTSGSEYQALLPLIEKLDVLPRQVMLDITIAEVTLSDDFKYGVEWALNSGKLSMGTKDAFGVTGIGGFNFGLSGTEAEMTANFLRTNSLVKVLSNPTLLVRDGVSANINVGSDISVIGETTVDPINGERQTTTSDYRKTGVDITVTPSINAKGIVIMEIQQKISNSVPDSSGAGGNPDIFERSISTEVVAQSGQTIILGGLISENINQSDKKTPWIADIPIIGELFKATGDSSTKTELVMLITPKVIDRTDQWDELTESFKQGLEYLNVE